MPPCGQPVETNRCFHRLPTRLGKVLKLPSTFPQFHSPDDDELFIFIIFPFIKMLLEPVPETRPLSPPPAPQPPPLHPPPRKKGGTMYLCFTFFFEVPP